MPKWIFICLAAPSLIAAASHQGEQQSIADENARSLKQAFEGQLAAAGQLMKSKGMSEAGVSIVLGGMRTEQKEQWRIFDRESGLLKEVQVAADAAPFDARSFEASLERLRDQRAAAFSDAINAEVEILHKLSPHDRPIFARLTHGAPAANGARLGMPPRPLKGSN